MFGDAANQPTFTIDLLIKRLQLRNASAGGGGTELGLGRRKVNGRLGGTICARFRHFDRLQLARWRTS